MLNVKSMIVKQNIIYYLSETTVDTVYPNYNPEEVEQDIIDTNAIQLYKITFDTSPLLHRGF